MVVGLADHRPGTAAEALEVPASTVGGLGTEHLNVLTEMTSKPVILRFLFQP